MRHAISLLLCACMVAAAAAADTLKVGDLLPAFTAKDQHGQQFELKSGIRLLFVSFDMSSGKDANKYFATKGPGFLDNIQAAYLSNIHGMPAIGRAFALPKMRKYPHRIVLADSEDLLRNYPAQKDHITILSLDPNLKITAIDFWAPNQKPPAHLLKQTE